MTKTKFSAAKFAFDVDDKLKDRFTNNVTTVGEIAVTSNIPYDADVDVCKADVYFPPVKSNGKYPVLLLIHGGGWVTGDKYLRRGQCRLFADMGLCVVAPNYGLSPDYRYPDCVRHLYRCMNWIADSADEYGFDLANVFITGDSAGAHLAALIAATQHNAEFAAKLKLPANKLNIKSGILACGAYDIDKMMRNPVSGRIFSDMCGVKKKECKNYEFYDTMCVKNYVTPDFPPDMLITYGRFDAFVGGHEKLLFNLLDKCGVPYMPFRAGGVGIHCYHLFYKFPTSKKFYALCRDFFARELSDAK